ncbi:hypothetical protein BLA24064_00970 [Burkholderia latens]|uniref:Uncharacterized protein n=1 Tax=Burkholderia latens TaxID=488446 RepID=A0A6P2I452_9BURK|nr:hypothetical protein BLA24064_00970 [Burkholderia latens]
MIAGAEADQARHTDIEQIVPFDMLLAAPSVSASATSSSCAPAQPLSHNSATRFELSYEASPISVPVLVGKFRLLRLAQFPSQS